MYPRIVGLEAVDEPLYFIVRVKYQLIAAVTEEPGQLLAVQQRIVPLKIFAFKEGVFGAGAQI